jgi:hypothetical protein
MLLVITFGCTMTPDYASHDELARLSARREHAVSQDELRATCTGLTEKINSEIAQMKELQNKAKSEQDNPPPNLLRAWQRAFDEKGAGIAALEEFEKKRRRVEEMNATLDARGCKTVDVEEKLKAPAQTIETKSGRHASN